MQKILWTLSVFTLFNQHVLAGAIYVTNKMCSEKLSFVDEKKNVQYIMKTRGMRIGAELIELSDNRSDSGGITKIYTKSGSLEVSNNGKACNYSGKNEDNINNKILEVFKIKESILANNPKELESLRKSCRDYVYDYLKEQGTLPKDTLSSETGAKTGIGRKVVD